MTLRPYREEDLKEILSLFYRSVHELAAEDYTPAQLDAWAPSDPDEEGWRCSLAAHYALVAEEDGRIVGFGDLDGDYLDRLYVLPEMKGRGAGSLLCGALEERARAAGEKRMTAFSSRTALSFFAGRGYAVLRENTVERRGRYLINYKVEKIF